jgi:hypothetical protein
VNEPATALTDYALAAECALLAALCGRAPGGSRALSRRLALFFAATGVAALLGGVTHGSLAPGNPARLAAWRATLLAAGAGATAAWLVGAQLGLGARAARAVGAASLVQLVLYGAAVLRSPQPPFALAVALSLPAALFLLAVLLRAGAGRAALGVALVLAASGLQQLRVGLHPELFDHNALYHVLHGVALAVLFSGVRPLLEGPGRKVAPC